MTLPIRYIIKDSKDCRHSYKFLKTVKEYYCTICKGHLKLKLGL